MFQPVIQKIIPIQQKSNMRFVYFNMVCSKIEPWAPIQYKDDILPV